MSWTKKENEAPTPVDLCAFRQPAPEAAPAQSANEETAPKKTPVPTAMLTPEMQAYTSHMISEAVRGVFASMGPLLSSIALTPEKLAEAEKLRRAPDPAAVARELRERRMTQQEAEENRANLLRNQAACPHRYPTGQLAINVVRNFPDRQPRFTCALCTVWINPREWQIGPPDAENPRGKPFIAEAHPQYKMAMEVLATKG